ncbi:hypothetical protein M8818_006702 [Zalaria obscura]|uniref:Uncharacterized protein n=1 Tax=Zalaria obscura TaxID=2024903 RepID=A0ACC3S6K1_9PEZI
MYAGSRCAVRVTDHGACNPPGISGHADTAVLPTCAQSRTTTMTEAKHEPKAISKHEDGMRETGKRHSKKMRMSEGAQLPLLASDVPTSSTTHVARLVFGACKRKVRVLGRCRIGWKCFGRSENANAFDPSTAKHAQSLSAKGRNGPNPCKGSSSLSGGPAHGAARARVRPAKESKDGDFSLAAWGRVKTHRVPGFRLLALARTRVWQRPEQFFPLRSPLRVQLCNGQRKEAACVEKGRNSVMHEGPSGLSLVDGSLVPEP